MTHLSVNDGMHTASSTFDGSVFEGSVVAVATVAVFTLAADEFPLGTVFADLPDITVQLERVVPDGNTVVPYFWVRGTNTETIIEKFSSHPGVTDIRFVDRVNGEQLLRCKWVAEYDSILDALVDPDVVLLSAVGTTKEWTFEIRGDSHEAIATFQQYCHEHDIPVTLTELHALKPLEAQHELTKKQREAIILAFERGYFDSPRKASLQDVATDLAISRQALASRLRRGTRRLIEETLIKAYS